MRDRQSMSYKYLYSILLLLCPIILSVNTYEAFPFPKMMFVYIFGFFIITLFLTHKVNLWEKITLGSRPVAIYLVAFSISTVLSSHIYTSVWGYYSRFVGGLMSAIVFYGLYIVGINVFNRKRVLGILEVGALTVLPLSVYGIIQHYGYSYQRVHSTIGQPNWLAQYIVMVMPVILYSSLVKKSNFWSLVFLLCYACLWFTYSISGMLGFIVMLAFFLYFLFREKLLNIRITFLLVCMIAFSLLNPGIFGDRVKSIFQDMRKITEAAIVVHAQEGQLSDPGVIRLGIWQGTLALAFSSLKNFIFGTGPETFPYEFQKFRPAGLNFSSEWDFVVNKPHNYYLELLAEQGVVGLVFWGAVFVGVFRKVPFYLKAGLAGYLVTNIFGWPTVNTELLFWMFAAYAGAKTDE